jgi:hypothetical protein
LLIEGEPIMLSWRDCHGGVEQHFVQTSRLQSKDRMEELHEFPSSTTQKRSFRLSLSPLLSMFASGIYRITYTPRVVGEWHVESPCDLQSYYPHGRVLICTQLSSPYANHSASYRAGIRDGARPIVITATAANAWCEFVIDGHDKIEAYVQESVSPSVLSIERWDAPPISLPLGVSCFSPGHPRFTEYHRMKTGGR